MFTKLHNRIQIDQNPLAKWSKRIALQLTMNRTALHSYIYIYIYMYIYNLILYEISGQSSVSLFQFHIKNNFILVKYKIKR